MILKSCYVENYGGLSGKSFEFSPSLTCVLRENGAGKTTLASFLRAMFYGLPATKTTSVTFNDRERFYPFNGGKFGGSLTYESGGKTYKIERFFDKKSPKGDSVKLYENGKEISAPYDLGLELFGVDEQTFSRTVFFGGDFLDGLDGKGLKLNDIVGDEADGTSYEDAVSAIEEGKKKYKAVRGDKGVIKNLKEDKRNAERRIENYAETEKSLLKRYDEKTEAENYVAAVKNRYDNAVKAQTVKAQRSVYAGKVKEAEQTNAELYKFKVAYPRSIPSKIEIDGFAKKLAELNGYKTDYASAAMTPDRKYALSALEMEFAENPLSKAKLDELRVESDKITEKTGEVRRLAAAVSQISEDRIVKKFDACPVEDGERERADELKREYLETEELLKAEEAAANKVNDSKKPSYKAIISVLGVLLAAGGVGLAFLNLYAGIAVGAVGLIALISSLFIKSEPKNHAQNRLTELTAKANMSKNELSEFLSSKGYYSREGVLVGMANFSRDYDEYLSLKAQEDEKYRTLEKTEKDLASATKAIKAELTKYGYGDTDIKTAIGLLAKKYNDYLSLKDEKEYYARRAEEIKKRIDESERFFADFSVAYKLGGDKSELLEKMRSDRLVADNLKARLDKLKTEIAAFGDMPEELPTDELSAEELAEVYDDANKRLAKINADITVDENTLEDYPDAVASLEAINEDISAAEEKYSLLCDTLDFLAKAEKTIKDEYVAPVLNKFKEYVSGVSREFGENADMDKDFCVKFERNGELRSDKYFSAGQRAVIALCLRLALAEQTFKAEKPFIVLDDPFFGLDEEHFEKIKPVLDKLSGNEQIIYFTCHPSREI